MVSRQSCHSGWEWCRGRQEDQFQVLGVPPRKEVEVGDATLDEVVRKDLSQVSQTDGTAGVKA